MVCHMTHLLRMWRLCLRDIMMLAVQKRDNEDERTLGELFYLAIDEMADISFSESMLIIIEAMRNSMKEIIHATDEQLAKILEVFLINFLIL